MRDKIKLKIDSLREELKDIPHLTRTFKKLESMYATKEQIEANAQSLQLLHSPFGVEFDLNDTIRTETLLPNPIGGEPLPAKYLVVLTEINQEEGYCVLEAEQILDKEKSRDFIIDFMMQVLPKKIDKDTIVRILDDFEIRDKTLYSMDLNTGWILNCDFTRTVKAGELFALQTINIEMKFEEENNTDGNTFNTRDAFVENFGNEILSAEDVYANLKSNGLKEYQKSVFDIHFESDSKAKLQNIREFLESIYGFTFQEEIVHDDIFEIRMTTDSIPVSKETLLFFTLDMAKRAYEFDCGFGAFGTEIDKSPNFPKLELGYVLEYYDKALEEYYKGNTSKAMIYWTLIIEIDSANEEIYYNRAIAKNELFLSKSALLDYDKALEINPNYTDALLNRASLRDEMEDYQGALTDLNKLIELEPENERAYFNRGNTYQHMDNLEAACSEWNKALELGMEEAQERIEEFCE